MDLILYFLDRSATPDEGKKHKVVSELFRKELFLEYQIKSIKFKVKVNAPRISQERACDLTGAHKRT